MKNVTQQDKIAAEAEMPTPPCKKPKVDMDVPLASLVDPYETISEHARAGVPEHWPPSPETHFEAMWSVHPA